MGLKETFETNFKAGRIKVSHDVAATKAAAEGLAKLSKADLEKRLDDVAGLLKEVGVELDPETAKALQAHIADVRSAKLSQAAVVHIDI